MSVSLHREYKLLRTSLFITECLVSMIETGAGAGIVVLNNSLLCACMTERPKSDRAALVGSVLHVFSSVPSAIFVGGK